MDLHAIEPVLSAPIGEAGGGVGGRPAIFPRGALRSGLHPASLLGPPSPLHETRPLPVKSLEVVDAAIIKRVDLDLPHDLRPRGRVGAAERHLAYRFILQGGNVTLPDVQVGQVSSFLKGVILGKREVGLSAIGELLGLVLTEDSFDVVASGTNAEISGARRRDPESKPVDRTPIRSDQVRRQEASPVKVDVGLLVPIRVQLDAALLHEHAAVVPGRVEGETTEIAFHQSLPYGFLRSGHGSRYRFAALRPASHSRAGPAESGRAETRYGSSVSSRSPLRMPSSSATTTPRWSDRRRGSCAFTLYRFSRPCLLVVR